MKIATHHHHNDEHTGMSSYVVLDAFVILIGYASVTMLGGQWNSLMYTISSNAKR